MAQQGYPMDSVKFSCSICLDLLKTPVTIPCGHNYCMYCIGSFWDDEDKKGIHSCPQCRQQFTPRPVLVKNTMLAELVEDVRKTGPQPAPDDDSLVGPEDVACDICTVRKMKAIKSCLVCLVSYCENHLQPHYDIPGLKKHKLVNPSKTLQDNICSHHDEVMKIFCRTDQQCICYLCLMAEHKGHETVPAAAERADKKKELQESRQQIHQRIQDQEKDVKLLQQEVETINVSADKAVEDSEKIFTEMIRLLQERSSEVKQQIRSQQETEVSRVKDVQEKLEQEITELKRKDAELEQLSHTEDHTQFLLNYPSLPALRESTHSSSINIRPLRHFEDVTAAVTELKTKVLDILRDPPKTSSASKADVLPQPMAVLPQPMAVLPQPMAVLPQPMAVLPQPMAVSSQPSEPKTREDFLKYSRKLTLSRNTAHKFLELSEGNRKVTMTNENQYYEDHEDRFTRRWQVLSKQRLTGRCYWEVEWTQGRSIEVAVAYDNIERTGDTKESTFGLNENSWALCCQPNSYKYYGVDVDDDDDNDGYNDCYNDDYNDGYDDAVVIPVTNPYSSRVGVYLDHRAGILSFYSVYGSQMTLIHKAETTFTQPLHAGIWLSRSKGTSAEFIQLK
ncbi:PREDICTED: tripartite motif-containing protein 16-like isoform X2 [Poecilia mexicana]|uniref:tripartite motif-containing protein 16-like isoform X2 n=1 Tax=Poecilia mexicana TaxID=48701 RepID=UPI00072E79F0|nr:PREDICTED: tripartite motif-containing protein 16-like isoform X2 [Poecilia mexicana]